MLIVSRKDIDTENIAEYPVETRFIKLPITKYLQLLGAWEQLNKPQTALINAINNPKYRFITAAFSRRLGKTFIANIIAQLVSLIPGCNVLIISPNYNLSSISFELQRKFIRHFDLEITRDNLKDKIIELANGSTVRMGSLSTVDSTVGRSYDLILFDEAALGGNKGEEAFNVQLRPTLDKIGSKAIFISTPRGRLNFFSKFYNRGFSPEFPEWVSLKADYTENPRMSVEDVEEAKRSMSSAEFAQEYLADFAIFEGQIYKYRAENTIEYEHTDNALIDTIAGCDPGFRDPTAFLVIKYNPYTGIYHVVDEYLNNEQTSDKHAAVFKELTKKWSIDSIFIDPNNAQFISDLAYLYDVATLKAKKDVLAGINIVAAIIEQDRLKVSPHCIHTLAALDQYRWKVEGGIEKPHHDEYSHMADALRYAIHTFVP